MPSANAMQSKVHFQGKDEDFIVYVDSAKAVEQWRSDKSIALTNVVSRFKIFISHKHGAQSATDTASKATLENEFGTSNEDECIIKILQKGTTKETESSERSSSTNDSNGARIGH